jgi:hypothetical protein
MVGVQISGYVVDRRGDEPPCPTCGLPGSWVPPGFADTIELTQTDEFVCPARHAWSETTPLSPR